MAGFREPIVWIRGWSAPMRELAQLMTDLLEIVTDAGIPAAKNVDAPFPGRPHFGLCAKGDLNPHALYGH